MILIADSGSTRTTWCLAGEPDIFFETEGYNPYFVDRNYIITSLQRSLPPSVVPDLIKEIYFYSAGSADTAYVLRDVLTVVFPGAACSVEDDTLAAARALLGHEPGFAAILGTGSNTCIYDGRRIVHNIDSLGFVLGDEGSGGAMGKKLIGDFIREIMPADLRAIFSDTYRLSANELIDHVYNKPLANRFCAGFSKFLYEHIGTEYAQRVVRSSFDELFANLVTRYPGYDKYAFNCVGSIGYYFQGILRDVARDHGMKPGRILSSPIEELVAFHKGM